MHHLQHFFQQATSGKDGQGGNLEMPVPAVQIGSGTKELVPRQLGHLQRYLRLPYMNLERK